MHTREATATQPSRAHALDHEWADEGEIDLFGGVLFFWRFRYLIAAITLTAAGLGLLSVMTMSKEYTATSTVFLNTPRQQNPLAPEPLSTEALDRLAGSELVRMQVSADLRKRRLTDSDRQVFDFKTILYKSSEPQKPYLPLIGLSAVASSPELARDAADSWATALMTETTKLTTATRASAVDFIVTEYPKAAARLNERERHLEGLRRQHGQGLLAARTAAAVSLRKAQLASHEQLIVELEGQRDRLSVELKEAQATVAALEQELKQVSPLIVVSKAITDEALWDSAARNSGKPPVELNDARLRTEEINLVHADLTRKVADARVKRGALLAKRPALEAQIDRSRRETAAIRASLGIGELAIANLELRQQTEVAEEQREVEGARSSFKKFEERIGDAQIVKAEKETLTLGSRAEIPDAPSGPKVIRTVGIAGLAGFLIAVSAAWIADRAKRRSLA